MGAEGVIAALEPHPKRRHSYQIRINGDEPLTVHEDVIVALQLHVGMRFTAQLRAQVERQQLAQGAWESALRLLRVHSRSRQELTHRLEEKGYSQDVVDMVLAKLENSGLVNDVQFARDLTRGTLRRRPLGRRGLHHQLLSRGVGEEVAKSVVTETLEGGDETERAVAALSQRLGRWNDLPAPARREKAYRYLARLGFDADTIADALSMTLSDE